MSLRVAILECGVPSSDILRSWYPGYGAMFEELLCSEEKPDLQLVVTKWLVDHDGATYPELDDVDVILISGSKHSAYLDVSWINRLVEFTSQALRSPAVRVVGICFGHQILGRAMGAPVEKNKLGWEVSVCEIDLNATGKLLFKRDKLSLQFSHQDIVLSCPAHVQNLGSSPKCDIQGFFWPGRLLSLQGHPEFNERIMRETLKMKQQTSSLTEDEFQDAMIRVAQKHDGHLVGQVLLKFMLGQE
ncbi:hypothetical protein A1O3_00183 [Capronia epimyces CBS 606.96]|uniref:Glutamine amidotransferase domain-containing protein n=1 Tax=Capronia epimyces CBS 606.96 TaxID=1182542 RepID=W9YGF3_9EURO|nr:uncharacterized protein A1O3_00183 [Capronia epimyces CBS 606.96]EXJ91633.1 hypothetical protein A1O3_00183 [Capronia epimyces CBS 606.96]